MAEFPTQVTPIQEARILELVERTGREYPQAEVKDLQVTVPTEAEVKDPRTAGLAVVRLVLGYPEDQGTFREALRIQKSFLVSPRGRVEPWDARQAFGARERKPTTSKGRKARKGAK